MATDISPEPSIGQSATTSPSSKGPKRKKQRWQATVELPRGKDKDSSPRFILNVGGRTVGRDTLDGLDLGEVLPGRTFVSRATSRSTTERPYLNRLGHRITVESETEAIEAHLQDRDPAVRTIVPQGVWVKTWLEPYDDDGAAPAARGRWAFSCVDFLVGHVDGSVHALEVKRNGWLFHQSAAQKMLATASTCAAAGVGYQLLEGLGLRERQMFRRLHLHRRANLHHAPAHVEMRRALVERAKTYATFCDLREMGPSALSAALIWELIWTGALCVDWTKTFGEHDVVACHGVNCATPGARICGPGDHDLLSDLRDWWEN